jgi:hypothetical protein
MINSKSEYRNSKQILIYKSSRKSPKCDKKRFSSILEKLTKSKILNFSAKCFKHCFRLVPRLDIEEEFWSFGIRNCLGFRVLKLGFSRMKVGFIFLSTILLLIISCQKPEIPEGPQFHILSVCSLPGYAKGLDIVNNFAYVANGQGGLQIIDISNPESTFVVGSYITANEANAVAIRDTFAYLAITSSSNGGLVIANVADPTAPFFVGQDASIYCYDVVAPEDDTIYVYLAARYWFHVEDVYTYGPQYPSYARRFPSPGGDFRSIYMVDTMAYLACEQMGMYIYNLAKPDSLALVGWQDTPSNARNVVVSGTYAYIADGRGGLVIIDVTDSENPDIISIYNTPEYANDVFVSGNYAYIADGDGGLQIIDIDNPADPLYYGSIETSYAYSVYVEDEYIYVADRDMGLVIIVEEEE